MKKLSSLLALVAFMFALTLSVRAEEKEVTLKGNITCAKCELKKEKSCMTVIVVKEKDKDVVYYFDTDGHKKYHGKVCTEGKEGEVKGTVAKKGAKMVVTVSDLKFAD